MAVTTAIEGIVNSVDLTQSPPLLSIGGQTYTVSQIQSIAELARPARLRRAMPAPDRIQIHSRFNPSMPVRQSGRPETAPG